MTQREEILQWLNGPRSYDQGIDIYQRYGFNLMLKQMFRRSGRTDLTEMTLLEELRKLANLTEAQLKAIKPTAALSVAVSQQPSTRHSRPTATDATKQAIRFRERFPFLNEPSCPDVLKVAVADMFTAYGRYKEAHAKLQTIDDAAPDAAPDVAVPSVAVSQQPSSQPSTPSPAAQLSQEVVEMDNEIPLGNTVEYIDKRIAGLIEKKYSNAEKPKKAVAKKEPAKKVAVKKAPVKKEAAKKEPVKKEPVKKATVKKAAVKEAPAKKVAAKKAPAKKAAPKKETVKKAPAKKAPAKKAPAKKAKK